MKNKTRVIAGALFIILLVGGSQALAVMTGRSNAPSGTFITQPHGSAVLSAALPTTFRQGMTSTTTVNLQNGVGSSIIAHVELTLSRPGISSSDVTVTLAGNAPLVISCDSTNCTYVGSSWSIDAGVTSPYDVSLMVNIDPATFAWSMVAVWTT